MASLSPVIVTTSWDDGHPLDLKLAELLTEFGIRGTFYVAPRNGERPVMTMQDLQELGQGFEIGAHTRSHASLPDISEGSLEEEILGSKHDLEDMLGTPVGMFCYPAGRYDERARQAVVAADFIGARTTRDYHLTLGADPWQMPTTLQAFPHRLAVRLRHGLRTGNWHGVTELLRIGPGCSWVRLACLFLGEVLETGGIWHLWGHSWEIEAHGLWDDLRTVLAAAAYRDGVSYLTNGEVILKAQGPVRNSLVCRQ